MFKIIIFIGFLLNLEVLATQATALVHFKGDNEKDNFVTVFYNKETTPKEFINLYVDAYKKQTGKDITPEQVKIHTGIGILDGSLPDPAEKLRFLYESFSKELANRASKFLAVHNK